MLGPHISPCNPNIYKLGLHPACSEVMRSLGESLLRESRWKTRWIAPSLPAISQDRERLGVESLAELFERGWVKPCVEQTPGAFSHGPSTLLNGRRDARLTGLCRKRRYVGSAVRCLLSTYFQKIIGGLTLN
jgi:hypothetical protein